MFDLSSENIAKDVVFDLNENFSKLILISPVLDRPAGHGDAFRGEGMETIRKWSSYGRSLSPEQDFPSLGPGPFPVQSWGGGRSVQSIK